MTTASPHINRFSRQSRLVLAGVLVTLAAASAAAASVDRVCRPAIGTPVSVRMLTISYRAHTGATRHAEVLLPSWYGPAQNPSIPLVISPHGRGAKGNYNAEFWGTMPTAGGFAVVNPDGMGRRLGEYSYGAPGQIDDLARMPDILRAALPWVHVDRNRIFALGSSMGGQETLLLVARHPGILAGAVAMDSVTNLTRRYRQLPLISEGRGLQSRMRTEVGGTPWEKADAYAARSPLSLAESIAQSGVPLQIWWSTRDRIVIDQKHQSGALYRALRKLQPRAEVKAYVGGWRHSSEMRSSSLLPVALVDLGLLPRGIELCPNVRVFA